MSFQSTRNGALDKMGAHPGFHPSYDFENAFHFTREQP